MTDYRRTHSCTGEEDTDLRLEDGKCGYSETVYAYNTERKCKSGCACETCVEAGTVRGEGNSTAAAQADANSKAQQQANSMTCKTQYSSVAKSGSATRNNCGSGCTGSSVTYTVAAGTYKSCVSQSDADSQAQRDVDNNKQSYANSHGSCTCPSCEITGRFEFWPDVSSYARVAGGVDSYTVDGCTGGTARMHCYLINIIAEQSMSGFTRVDDHHIYFDFNPGGGTTGWGAIPFKLESGKTFRDASIDVDVEYLSGTCKDCDVNMESNYYS